MEGLREFIGQGKGWIQRRMRMRNSGPQKAVQRKFTQEEMSASHAATCQQQRVRQLTNRLMSRMFLVIGGPCQHSEFLN
ncbi:hypothetical protein BKI49_12375 [Streptomyces sp. Tue6028]|nr:hypothetical protein BKI49_12375 [Streptomyces sp. Tue6028]